MSPTDAAAVRHSLAAAALLALGMISLSACTATPRGDSTGAEITPEEVDVFSLSVGDCLNTSQLSGASEVQTVPLVPCRSPHEDEVYYAVDSTDEEFPGRDAMSEEAQGICVDAFDDFVGMAYEDSVLDILPLFPSDESWAEGDREIVCIIYDTTSELVTGTLAGVAR